MAYCDMPNSRHPSLPLRFAVLVAVLSIALPLLIRDLHAQDLPAATTSPVVYLPGVRSPQTTDGVSPASEIPEMDAFDPVQDEPSATLRRIVLPAVLHYGIADYRPIPVVPVAGGPIDRPAAINGDLNLALRGYTLATALPALIDIGGPTDDDPPQLATLFSPARRPAISAVYRVNDWNWNCGANGCRGEPIVYPPVTMIALSAQLGEKLYAPARAAEIYGGGYKALVLYADERRITLKYTREDSPVWGYMIHLEEIGVDPSLLLRYREMNAAGRANLPALRSGDLVGYAIAPTVQVAVRDTGMFMDPRTRKDWWKGW